MFEQIKKIVKTVTNPYEFADKVGEISEERKKKGDIHELEEIKNEEKNTEFNEEGNFEYAEFVTRHKHQKKMRILRLLRVIGTSEATKTKINNQSVFESILQDFGDGSVSFVTLYSGGPKEDTLICYGVVMEGNSNDREKMIEKTGHYIETLETKFRSRYKNIDIVPLTRKESYLFSKFGYNHLTVLRGVPRSDNAMGSQTGTNHSNPFMNDRQVGEVILGGFEATKKNGVMETEDYLFLFVLDPIQPQEILDGINYLNYLLNRTDASMQYGKGESDSIGFPLLMTPSVGEQFGTGTSESDSVQHTVSDGVSDGTMWNESKQMSQTKTEGEGEAHQKMGGTNESQMKGKADSAGGTAGVKFLIDAGGNYNHTWNESNTTTTIDTEGNTTSKQTSESEMTGAGTSNGGSKSTSHTVQDGSGHVNGKSVNEGKTNALSGVGGVSQNNALNVMRQLKDYQNIYATEILQRNLIRYQRGYNDGMMFEARMMILTKSKEGKVLAEELAKSAYKDENASIPVRVQRYDKNEEKKLIEHVKGFSRPFATEKRKYLVEDNRYTTFITANEAAASAPPQENYAGYTSSFDEIPPAATKPGVMADGLGIGKQIDVNQNEVTSYEYKIPFGSLGHIGVFGNSGSGKTQLLFKLIKELRKKKYNVLSLDWAKNHRKMLGLLNEKSSVRFNSFNPKMELLKINFLVPPKGVSKEVWNAKIVYFLCHSFGFGRRQYATIKHCVDLVTRKKTNPTMKDLIEEIEEFKIVLANLNQRGQLTFQQEEMFVSMNARFDEFKDEWKLAYKLFNDGPFTPIETLVEGDFFHLIECATLPENIKKFMMNTILTGIYLFCKSADQELPKPMFVILEEAHSVLGGGGDTQDPLPKDEDIFEEISREARNYKLFVVYVCQEPQKIEEQIFGNLMITITFRLTEKEGRDRIVASGGRDPVRYDVDLVKWIGSQPVGYCLVRLNQFQHVREGQFVPVKVDYEKMEKITDELFLKMYRKLTTSGRNNALREKK